MGQNEVNRRATSARPLRPWAGALLLLVLLGNLALTCHHYALAEHQSQETCHLCFASSAPGHSTPAAPGIPTDRPTQAEPDYTANFTLPEPRKGSNLARAPPSHPA